MGDDYCKPHSHYSRGERPGNNVCHHFFPRGDGWYCMGCGTTRQSVVNHDVSRRHKDRVDP